MIESVKNIIFDLGNVLVDLDFQRCIRAFQEIGRTDIAEIIADGTAESLFLDTELGHVDVAEFYNRVRKLGKNEATDAQILWAWNEMLVGVSVEKKQRLLALNASHNVFLLSNTNDMHWQKCANDFFPYLHFGVKDYFQQVFLSYEMHLKKPSLEIFSEVLSAANIRAEETIFIDDSAENCQSAASLGIKTFHNVNVNDWLALDFKS